MKKIVVITFLAASLLLQKNNFAQENHKLLIENKTDQELYIDVESSFKCVSTSPRTNCGFLAGKKTMLDFSLEPKTTKDIQAEIIKELNINPQKMKIVIESIAIRGIVDKFDKIKIYGSNKLVSPQKTHYAVTIRNNKEYHVDQLIIEEVK